MKTPHDIILRPVITERSMAGIRERKYTFAVAVDANKIEISKAVETLFSGAKVEKVNTMNVRGKLKRMGKYSGYTSKWKKAIVTLEPDSKGIEFLERLM